MFQDFKEEKSLGIEKGLCGLKGEVRSSYIGQGFVGCGEDFEFFLEYSGKQLKGCNRENFMVVGWRLGQWGRRGGGEFFWVVVVVQGVEGDGLISTKVLEVEWMKWEEWTDFSFFCSWVSGDMDFLVRKYLEFCLDNTFVGSNFIGWLFMVIC